MQVPQCTYACTDCYARTPFKFGDSDSSKYRTLGQLRKLCNDYKKAKEKKKSTLPADYYNVISMPAFTACSDDTYVLDVLTVPGIFFYTQYCTLMVV